MVKNATIAKKFKLAAKLMELHGENDFKVRSYTKVVDAINAYDKPLYDLEAKELGAIDGIGKSSVEKILEISQRGSFSALDDLLQVTPKGVIEMMGLPGFGPKKVYVIWKEGGAESLEDVRQLCLDGKIAGLKGFGDKSQDSLFKAVNFLLQHRGYFRYATIEPIFQELIEAIKECTECTHINETGDLRRRMEVINLVEILVGTDDFEATREKINGIEMIEEVYRLSGPFTWRGVHKESGADVRIFLCKTHDFSKELIKTTGSAQHLNINVSTGKSLAEVLRSVKIDSEESAYQSMNLPFIAPELREGMFEMQAAENGKLPILIEMSDLKGVLHNHSTYSDGKHSLREMAEHCRDLGYEYLGITDHSQTAVYANGLQEFKVREQQEEIRKLNEELAPFIIFSGIESDILTDGSLDYSEEILASFDFIVASVHSAQSMDINKATNRLLTAIANPYTTILGHMTGRLLLEREGYPVDHKAVIDACIEQNVVIEINASPYRLDMDWRWVHYGIENGLMLSINPDAHKKEGYQDMYYGLLAGRKGGLTKEHTLNCLNATDLDAWFKNKKLQLKTT